ncbi:MAG: hypothetical protein UR14_C0001G0064 [candidate division TM6 bacterium GW2011_GWE2_31_21]|nr:MAG: hypothetical protein UR14_C0001G0064 [candidate division TM6 bacterium GW2011_GWE2_31_21]KKP54056.1 MAG: hypothetical protein UR43_C0001G0074 [candidate division TM6 bacterium GW2011_GWF2_33_332]
MGVVKYRYNQQSQKLANYLKVGYKGFKTKIFVNNPKKIRC